MALGLLSVFINNSFSFVLKFCGFQNFCVRLWNRRPFSVQTLPLDLKDIKGKRKTQTHPYDLRNIIVRKTCLISWVHKIPCLEKAGGRLSVPLLGWHLNSVHNAAVSSLDTRGFFLVCGEIASVSVAGRQIFGREPKSRAAKREKNRNRDPRMKSLWHQGYPGVKLSLVAINK